MHAAEPPNFRAVGPVERDYMHGIDMYRRMCDHAIKRIDRAIAPGLIAPGASPSHQYAERLAQVDNAQRFGEFMRLKDTPTRMTGKGERLPNN